MVQVTAEEREELGEAAYKGVTSNGYDVNRAERALVRVVERMIAVRIGEE